MTFITVSEDTIIQGMLKTNVTRLLEQRKIDFQVFELPPEKTSAEDTAEILGVAPELVYKTIVVVRVGSGKPILAVVPATSEVDLKKLARQLGEKKLKLPTQREAEELTGLQAGGISPLALINRGFQVCVDRSAQEYGRVHISGGQLGLNIRLPVRDLVRLTNARMLDIST